MLPLPAGLPPDVARGVLERWREPHRHHHGEHHLAEVLAAIALLAAADDDSVHGTQAVELGAVELGAVELGAVELAAVELAAWFHDAVHEGRPDDEERSAALANVALEAAGADAMLVDEVVRLVLLTRTHDPAPGDRAGALLCDADLAVLGADPQRHALYVADVRAEYPHVDDAGWRTGRAEVLRDLLALDPLFRTAAGRDRWEATARANLTAELAALAASGQVRPGQDRSGRGGTRRRSR